MQLLDQRVSNLIIIPPQHDFRLIVEDDATVDLPLGVLPPIRINERTLIDQSIYDARLSINMSFLELLNRVNLSINSRLLSSFTLGNNPNSMIATTPQSINNLYASFARMSHEDLLKSLIADYPVALWGVITTLTPEDVAVITSQNMVWAMKAMSENRAHMQRVSKICGILMTYITRSQRYDGESREILEAIFYECGLPFAQDSVKYYAPLITLGMALGARMHDIGKSRILQVIYQPKPLTIAERDVVDKHVELSLHISEVFIHCVTLALALYGPNYLQIWDIVKNVAISSIKYHHPERTGLHSLLGDLLVGGDVFDVLTRPRIYKLTYKSPAEALQEMSSIPHLNKSVVRLLMKALQIRTNPAFIL